VADTESSAKLLELERVLTSHSFAKSPRLCSLLGFIVAQSLKGDHGNLTEQQIGIQIFGRVPGYNSSEDTIVRVTVRQLRQRLDIYYSSEGTGNEFRIDIPKGGYIATVEKQAGRKVSESAAVVLASPNPSVVVQYPTAMGPQAPRLERRLYHLVSAVLAVMVVVLAVLCIQQRHALASQPASTGPLLLWNALFTPGRKTMIVPGDAALALYTVWEQRAIPLNQYVEQDYQRMSPASTPHKGMPLAARSVTPMADLALVALLAQAPEHMGQPERENSVEIRYARNVAVADTHDSNLVLIGAENFNPWVMLYQPQMDFIAHYDHVADVYSIQNKAPKPGEPSIYIHHAAEPTVNAFTHVALVNNSQGSGRVLIVEGTSMGSTYNAVNFLTSESLYAPVLRKATDRFGRLHDFEVLLSGQFLHGGVGNTKIVTVHVH
jgi:hypothetical protein